MPMPGGGTGSTRGLAAAPARSDEATGLRRSDTRSGRPLSPGWKTTLFSVSSPDPASSSETAWVATYCMAEGRAASTSSTRRAAAATPWQQAGRNPGRLRQVQSLPRSASHPQQNPRGADLWLAAKSDTPSQGLLTPAPCLNSHGTRPESLRAVSSASRRLLTRAPTSAAARSRRKRSRQ